VPLLSSRNLGAGERLYHHSRNLDELLKSGEFDPALSNYEGRIFFSTQQVDRTNCLVTVISPLILATIEPIGADNPAEEVSRFTRNWRGRVADGYDGLLAATENPYCKIGPELYCDEVVLFCDALRKLVVSAGCPEISTLS
jgi:hypothetical protein